MGNTHMEKTLSSTGKIFHPLYLYRNPYPHLYLPLHLFILFEDEVFSVACLPSLLEKFLLHMPSPSPITQLLSLVPQLEQEDLHEE